MGERTLNVARFISGLSAGQRHMVTFCIALLMQFLVALHTTYITPTLKKTSLTYTASIAGTDDFPKISPEQDINILPKAAAASYYIQADFFQRGLRNFSCMDHLY